MMNARAPLELFDPGDHLLGLVRERPSNILLFEGVILITQAEIEEKHIDTRRQRSISAHKSAFCDGAAEACLQA
jgi:hypothetical protein